MTALTHYERIMTAMTPWELARARAYVKGLPAVDASALAYLDDAPVGVYLARSLSFLHATAERVYKERGPSYAAFAEAWAPVIIAFWRAVGEVAQPAVVSQIVSAQAQVLHQMLSHEAAGKRVYEVSPGLACQLSETHLKGLRCEDLRLPYPSVLVQIPPVLGFRIWNTQTGWHPAESIYLTEIVEDDEAGRPQRLVRCLLAGTPKPGSSNPYDDAFFYYKVYMNDGVELDDAIMEGTRRTRAAGGWVDPAASHEDGAWWKAIWSWAVNVVLYATYPDAEVKTFHANEEFRKLWSRVERASPGAKRERLKAEARKHDPRTRRLLGASVVYVDRTGALAGHGAAGTGQKIEVRVRVAGHWKLQPYGPRSTLRKRIFVEPYIRGPEDSPLREALHRLKAKPAPSEGE